MYTTKCSREMLRLARAVVLEGFGDARKGSDMILVKDMDKVLALLGETAGEVARIDLNCEDHEGRLRRLERIIASLVFSKTVLDAADADFEPLAEYDGCTVNPMGDN